MLLAHPPVSPTTPISPKKEAAAAGLLSPLASPFMPTQSLTVLGHVRDPLPRECITSEQCMQDVEQARAHLAKRCAGAAAEEP